jgi:hypothetical protein
MKTTILRHVGRKVCGTRSGQPAGRPLEARAARSRRQSLRALWLRSPATGRLEMRWQLADAESEEHPLGRPAAA